MAAVAKNPKFAKKAGVPQSVGEDFLEADKGKKFRMGGTTNPNRAGINKVKTRSGMLQMPNASLKKFRGFNEGGDTMKPVDKEKNPGLAKLPTEVRNKMGYMKKGGMAMFEKSGKDVEKKGMKEGSKADMALDKKQMMGMKKGGMANSDMAEDKPMMKKIAKEEVKAHEKSMHKMAKGGVTRADGCVSKGHTKGKMIAMKKGGAC